MDTNAQLLLINTFAGGMDTDTSSININKNSYRYAENIRISLSDEHGIGDIHIINGVNKILTTFDYDSESTQDAQVIACQVAQNYVVLILHEYEKKRRLKNSGIPGHNYISVARAKNSVEYYKNLAQHKTFYKNNYSFHYGEDQQQYILSDVYLDIELYEDSAVPDKNTYDKMQFSSVYDAFSHLYELCDNYPNGYIIYRFFYFDENLQSFKPQDTLYELEYYSGDAQWRILVNDNDGVGYYKTVFGPCKETIYTAQDNFIKDVNTVINYVDSTHVYLYIADSNNNYPLTCLNVASNKYLGNSIYALTGASSSRITTQIVNGLGLMPYKKVQYLYRFKDPETGSTSVIMPPSKLLSIYEGINGGGFDSNTNSSKSVRITISLPPKNNFNRVEVYRIGYYGYNAYRLREIYDDVYNTDNDSFTITDSGYDVNTKDYGLDELLNFETTHIGKIIAKKDNRLFKSAVFDDLDNADIIFKDIDTISYTSGQSKINPYIHLQFNTSYLNYNEQYWHKPENDLERGGTGEYIDWEYVVAEHDVWAFSLIGRTTIAYPCLKSGEVYRFAIIFYMDNGIHTSPKWIADIMIPEDLNFSSLRQEDGKNVKFTTRSYSIRFTVNAAKIKQQIPAYSGYAIVTAKRDQDDKIVLSLGITSTSQTCSGGLNSDERYRNFASPETAYRKDDFFNLLNSYGKNSIRIDLLLACNAFRDLESITRNYHSGTGDTTVTYNFTATPSYIWPDITGTPDPDYLGLYAHSDRINRHMDIMIPDTNSGVRLGAGRYTIPYFFNPPVIGLTGITENGSGLTLLLDNYFITTEEGDNIYATSRTHLSDEFKKDYLFKDDNLDFNSSEWRLRTIGSAESMRAYGNRIGYKLYEHFMYFDSYGHDIITARLKRINVVPYGGHNELSIKNTEYRVNYDINYTSSEGSTYTVSSDGISSIGVFWFLASHNMIDNTYIAINGTTAEWIIVPTEADFDLNAIYGCDITQFGEALDALHVTENEHDRTYSFPIYGDRSLVLHRKLYMYDSTYNSIPQILVTGTDEDDLNSETFYNRIYASDLFAAKSEYNAWLKYTDNIQLDYEYGRITGLKFFKDRLYFWQERAFGVLYINENTMIQDKDNEHDILLSTSGILSDYKYISTHYGLKSDSNCIADSENFLYWWDEYKKEILSFDGKLVVPLSTVKNIKKYINSGTANIVPHVIYDYNNKDVLFCVVNDECVVYNEMFGCFTSIYKIAPRNFFYTSVGQLMFTNGNNIYRYDESVDGASYGFDDQPLYLTLKYIINKDAQYTKVFDTVLFYGSVDTQNDLTSLSFGFETPLNQRSTLSGEIILKHENQFRKITDRERDFRFSIPRDIINGLEMSYGGRLRGKFLECKLKYDNNNTDFSIQYINTKFRISWI